MITLLSILSSALLITGIVFMIIKWSAIRSAKDSCVDRWNDKFDQEKYDLKVNAINKSPISKLAVPFMIVGIILSVLFAALVQIPAGHTGVVSTFGKVSTNVLDEGLNFKIPFVQSVYKMDNRIVKLEVDTEAFSKDLQTVSTSLAVNYRVDPAKSYSIYKNIGKGYEATLVIPAVNEVLKAESAKYTAEETVTNRAVISDGLITGLNEKLNELGLYIEDVNILNYDFSEAYITAIEEKQVAQQNLLKAETDKQTAITKAEADAESTRIKAEAQAAANKALKESLTNELLESKFYEKWDGKLPQVMGEGTTITDIRGDEK